MELQIGVGFAELDAPAVLLKFVNAFLAIEML